MRTDITILLQELLTGLRTGMLRFRGLSVRLRGTHHVGAENPGTPRSKQGELRASRQSSTTASVHSDRYLAKHAAPGGASLWDSPRSSLHAH